MMITQRGVMHKRITEALRAPGVEQRYQTYPKAFGPMESDHFGIVSSTKPLEQFLGPWEATPTAMQNQTSQK